MTRPLGRLVPTDFKHVEKYPLTAATMPSRATPVVLGIDWYEDFDQPVKIGVRWWIGTSNDLGNVRGGHAICALPAGVSDLTAWWDFYNQGAEGACVGFSCSRAVSIMNRARYDARWLYKEAQRNDEWPGESYEGTSVRAGLERLRVVGHKQLSQTDPRIGAGISAYRWATSSVEVLGALQRDGEAPYAKMGGIPLLNSWGRGYPHVVWMPLSVLDYVLYENGEAAVITDR